jgi:hypothetical protein
VTLFEVRLMQLEQLADGRWLQPRQDRPNTLNILTA